jgi:small-conductance mechanosensitive channel
MVVFTYLYIATALFLTRPLYVGGSIVAATLLAVLAAYLVERRGARRRTAAGRRAPEPEPAVSTRPEPEAPALVPTNRQTTRG